MRGQPSLPDSFIWTSINKHIIHNHSEVTNMNKRNSHYPSIRLYDEVNRLRKRDSLPELDICQYGIALNTHFNAEEVPHVAEAISNLQDEGLEMRRPDRAKRSILGFLSRLKPGPEGWFPEE